MPLCFTSNRVFTQTCKAAGGETFTATFRVLPDDELKAIFEDGADIEQQKAFLRRAVTDLGELLDDARAPIAFTPGILEQALGQADMRLGMLRGYNTGIAGAKSGN